jgi:hypothetical protein
VSKKHLELMYNKQDARCEYMQLGGNGTLLKRPIKGSEVRRRRRRCSPLLKRM